METINPRQFEQLMEEIRKIREAIERASKRTEHITKEEADRLFREHFKRNKDNGIV